MSTNTINFQQILEHDVPTRFRVPGAATAILKDGELVAEHCWGYANIDTRDKITPNTIFPICSISKQMVSLVLTELITERGPQFADNVLEAVRDMLPPSAATDKNLTLERLEGMQSGLRDYWALTVLWGATPQERFSIYSDAPKAMKRLGKFHFVPGTQMSYANTNFVLVGLAIERVTGESMSDLLNDRVFGPAGMNTAALRPDTAQIPFPMIGYEGGEESGYIPYANRIEWAADAGVQASLQDMIAYEKYVHRTSQDEDSSYFKNAQEPKYIDGNSAHYGHGLVHGKIDGSKAISHSGGLPGFRLRRVFMPGQRLSVIVLLNCETDTKPVAEHILKKALANKSVNEPTKSKTEISWAANYFDEDSRLAVAVKQDKAGEVIVNYAGHDETLQTQSEHEARCENMKVVHENDGLVIDRLFENRKFTARPLAKTSEGNDAAVFMGKYYSEEIESTFHVVGNAGMLYGAFDGYLGQGPIHIMRWLGEDVWWLACFRSLDASPPGYWTVAFQRDRDNGRNITGVTVGNWLARKIEFKKVL